MNENMTTIHPPIPMGPCKVRVDELQFVVEGPGGHHLATVPIGSCRDGVLLPRDVMVEYARLFAAAPELLAALQAMVDCPDYRGIATHEMTNARKVLAKARSDHE